MNAKLILIPIFLIGVCAAQSQNDQEIQQFLDFILKPKDAPVTAAPVTAARLNPPPNLQTESSYAPCGDGKQCVRQYLCPGSDAIIDGATLIDQRIADVECLFLEKCCATGDEVTSIPIQPDTDSSDGCGFRNKKGVILKMKVITDNEAEFGEFPWMVAVTQKSTTLSKNGAFYKCGGSLITPKVVLTAAHSIYDMKAQNLLARAGEWETNSNAEPYAHQERQVVEIKIHEQFNSDNLINDIALLFLEAPFDLAPHVSTICLPAVGENFDMSRCFATGWGKNDFENGKYANILKKIDLPVVPNDKCQRDLRKTRLSKFFRLHSSFMCAGGEKGKDTCKGDGGSPLVCPMANNPDRYFQAGIVAWGIGCADQNVPGAYASVPQLRSWIDDQLADKNIDTNSFTPTI